MLFFNKYSHNHHKTCAFSLFCLSSSSNNMTQSLRILTKNLLTYIFILFFCHNFLWYLSAALGFGQKKYQLWQFCLIYLMIQTFLNEMLKFCLRWGRIHLPHWKQFLEITFSVEEFKFCSKIAVGNTCVCALMGSK